MCSGGREQGLKKNVDCVVCMWGGGGYEVCVEMKCGGEMMCVWGRVMKCVWEDDVCVLGELCKCAYSL